MLVSGDLRVPRVTVSLIVSLMVVYIVQQLPLIGPAVETYGVLVPKLALAKAQVWRLATYIFLHGGPTHLLFNCITLWFCGLYLEEYLGPRQFAMLFAAGGIGAAVLSSFMWNIAIVGASGAICALLGAMACYFPHAQVLLMFVVPIPMRLFVVGAGVVSILLAIGESHGNIAHLTHAAGIVVGIGYAKLLPYVERSLSALRVKRHESGIRRAAKLRESREQWYREMVDPILKKISREGMGSLTPRERRILRQGSRRWRSFDA